jgi:3',5'-cyclic AMP phosphodiesterase CpdA
MALTLGFLSDLHFGPEARFDGKLRKVSHLAEPLAREALRAMLDEARPDLLVNLGDDLEDESYEADLARYEACQRVLRGAGVPVVNVAGNHDIVHLRRDDLNRAWGREGPLYYALDHGGYHLVVLHTVEKKDVDVRIPPAQLAWLAADLSATTLPTIVLMHHPASEQDLADSRWFSRAPHLALVRERAELRRVLAASGKVRAVFNGHVHRNHVDVIDGIPYVTLQSLVENLEADEPARPAATWAWARFDDERVVVRVRGNDPARYQFELR